jgi:hypothetical protein
VILPGLGNSSTDWFEMTGRGTPGTPLEYLLTGGVSDACPWCPLVFLSSAVVAPQIYVEAGA